MVPQFVEDAKSGKISRREFLAHTTALGVAATTAYGLLGLAAPSDALADGHAQQGGTIRMQMEVRALKDPRTYDWTQIATYTAGWLEYLVEYNIIVTAPSSLCFLKAGKQMKTPHNIH